MWEKFPSLMLEKCVLVRVCRFVLGKNMGYTAEELYNAKQYNINDKVVQKIESKQPIKSDDLFTFSEVKVEK